MQQMMYTPSLINYKIMKCFYFERDNYCKYGNACQFAHSNSDLKTVDEISYLSSIATAINSDLNESYKGNFMGENQTVVNEQMLSNQISYNNCKNYQTYQESSTPDTNYGDDNSNQLVYPQENNYYMNYDHNQLLNCGYVYDPLSNQYYFAQNQYYDNSNQDYIHNQITCHKTDGELIEKNLFKENISSTTNMTLEPLINSVDTKKNSYIKKITIEIDNSKN